MTTQGDDPGLVLDTSDPGDDVQLRFRYQHSFAAIQCLKLLDATPAFDAVFCENHEDVLLRKPGGRYDGVQVKTRQFDGDLFRATDAAVMKSIARFATLEKTYPNRFDNYHFVTNHGFWEEEENGRNLAHLVAAIRQRGGVKGLPKTNPLRHYVCDVCDGHSCDEPDVATAITKLRLRGEKSDLDHTYGDLVRAIGQLRDYGSRPFNAVLRLADNLIFMAYEASSKTLGGKVADLYDLVEDYEARRENLLLAGKTITNAAVEKAIAQSFNDDAANLLIASHCVPESLLPPGVDVMTEKLAHGGLQTERVDLVKDYKASLEAMYLGWGYKSGVDAANQRLGHIKTMVRDDCVEAKIASEQPAKPYAGTMYEDLRKRLRTRVKESALPLFGCAEEHLVGAAGMLTEECKVWWSETFELKSRGTT